MAKDFLSDEEMSKLEAVKPTVSEDFISDEDMTRMETSSQPSSPSIIRSLGEGLTMGFAGELAGAAEAGIGAAQGLITGKNAFGNEGRLAALTSFSDNYKKARDTYDTQRKIAEEVNPVGALATEIVGSGITGIATAPIAAARGLGLVAQGVAGGGLSALGKSEKESVSGLAKDVGTGAALGGLFSWGLGKLFGKSAPVIQKGKDGSFKIDVGQGAKDVFKVSRETAESLSTPEAQNALRAELNAQKDGLTASIAKDFEVTEALKLQGLTEKGALPSKGLTKALENSWNKISSLTPEGDEVAIKSLEALKQRYREINQNLLTKSPTGSYDDVSLEGLEKVRSELGDVIFRNKSYDKVPQVKSAAVDLWAKLTDVLKKNDLDPITKQAGNLTKGLEAQRALYQISDEVDSLPSGDWIKGLANPNNSSAEERFKNLVKPLEKLAKSGNSDSLTNLNSYIANDFNAAVLKARISNLIMGETGSTLKASPKQAVSSLISGYKNTAVSKMGSALGSLDQLKVINLPVGRAITAPVDAGLSTLKQSTPYLSGSIASGVNAEEE